MLIGNGLINAIWSRWLRVVGYGLKDSIRSRWLRVINGPFVWIPVPVVWGGVQWECWFLLFSCLRKTLWGIESRNFICPWLYWGVISGLERWKFDVFWLKSKLHSNLLGRMKLTAIWKCIRRNLCKAVSGWVRVRLHMEMYDKKLG